MDLTALDRIAASWIGEVSAAERVFVFDKAWNGRWRMRSASPAPSFDRNAPEVQRLERQFEDTSEQRAVRNLRRDIVGCRVEYATDSPIEGNDFANVERLFGAYAHARKALEQREPLFKAVRRHLSRAWFIAGAVVLALLPVRLTVMAPAEVVGRLPTIVASPHDGIVSEVTVEAGEVVQAGNVLVRFEETEARNQLRRILGEVSVARAKLDRAERSAATDAASRSSIPVARAELALQQVRAEAARKRFDSLVLSAPSSGVAIVEDARLWTGRNVRAGERILTLADPTDTELELSLAAGDERIAANSTVVRFFPDGAPFRVGTGTVRHIAHNVDETADGTIVRRAWATLSAEQPAIGERGTAAILGPRVPLLYLVLRRPLSAVRQWWGW